MSGLNATRKEQTACFSTLLAGSESACEGMDKKGVGAHSCGVVDLLVARADDTAAVGAFPTERFEKRLLLPKSCYIVAGPRLRGHSHAVTP